MMASRIDNRMDRVSVDDQRITTIWLWCQQSYLQHGRKLNFPPDTDPRKTYQWRYITAIAKKFAEWDLDDAAAKKFITIAVAIADEHRVLHKGLAVLHQRNMLELCYDRLRTEASANALTLTSLQHIHQWLQTRLAGMALYPTLLSRDDPDAYCKLVIWYQASRLPPFYLSISRACYRAILYLEQHAATERALLPRVAELHIARQRFLQQDRKNAELAQQLLASDWRAPCL